MIPRQWPPAVKRYRVTGNRSFRTHEPGEEFVAALDPMFENRAVRRRSIEVLEIVDLSVATVAWTLPADWVAEMPLQAEERGAGERRLTTLERRSSVGV